MPFNQEMIDQQQELLATHRSNLAHYIKQSALLGGEAFAPLSLVNGIRAERTEIRNIKERLRANGVQVVDDPNDEPFWSEASNSNQNPATPSHPASVPTLPVDESKDQRPAVRKEVEPLRLPVDSPNDVFTPIKRLVGFIAVMLILLLLMIYLYFQYTYTDGPKVSSPEIWIDQQVTVTNIYVAVPVGKSEENLDKILEDMFEVAFEKELHVQFSDRVEIQEHLTYVAKPQRVGESSGYTVYVASVSGHILYPQKS